MGPKLKSRILLSFPWIYFESTIYSELRILDWYTFLRILNQLSLSQIDNFYSSFRNSPWNRYLLCELIKDKIYFFIKPLCILLTFCTLNFSFYEFNYYSRIHSHHYLFREITIHTLFLPRIHYKLTLYFANLLSISQIYQEFTICFAYLL